MRLATKTRRGMGGEPGERAACHSDDSDSDAAAHLQSDVLDPVSLKPMADRAAG